MGEIQSGKTGRGCLERGGGSLHARHRASIEMSSGGGGFLPLGPDLYRPFITQLIGEVG